MTKHKWYAKWFEESDTTGPGWGIYRTDGPVLHALIFNEDIVEDIVVWLNEAE